MWVAAKEPSASSVFKRESMWVALPSQEAVGTAAATMLTNMAPTCIDDEGVCKLHLLAVALALYLLLRAARRGR